MPTRILLLLVLVCALPLAACGKKAGAVDPPPGVSKTEFPRTYPDPATDPEP